MGAIQTIVDARAAGVRSTYDQLILGMQGAWMEFTQGMANPVLARMRLANQLADLHRAYAGLLRTSARDGIVEAHLRGVTDGGAHYQSHPDPALVEEAQDGIESALARDMRGLQVLASQTLARYSLAASRLPPALARQAALGELPSQGRDVFVQLDRLQRKRNSAEFVTASLRMTMFATYFNGFAAGLAESEQERFRAVHPERDPVELNLLDGWTAWAAENTHPNTRWHLERTGAA